VPRGALPPAPADAFVMGHATVDGRTVLVGATDPTVMGGSVGPGTIAKRRRLLELARLFDAPVVWLLDGPGRRTQHPNDATPGAADELVDLAARASTSTVVAAVLGPVAGHDALVAGCANHVVMTRSASVFGAGPPLVRATLGLEVTAGELGGPEVHAGGFVDHVADDEDAALVHVRAHLAGLGPARAPRPAATAGPSTRAVLPADPGRGYDVDALLATLADNGSWRRDGEAGGALATGTLEVGGVELAVVASDPTAGDGRIDVAAAEAARRRIERAAHAGTPLVVLADSPGPAIGPDAERSGTVPAVARLLRAANDHPGPILVVVVRRAHGDVPSVLGFGATAHVLVSLAFPGARLGPLPAETASAAVARPADVDALIEHTEFGGAVDAADRLVVDRVIDPDAVRAELDAALRGWGGISG
jgi:acetyl-CoA carboxylase carboxyltransferase component